ncbi:CYFA0S10e00672g1_1 [Cyberlindnera fabianii]|uniref:CYFA0S10e00672g1_1 n=1 Tax=Cyberlindnera fabianii TaxID=36022 RepID=A0A061AZJ2_CYBFA|nr:DnaJ subfamily C member 17 [Cyberlindnera fabianii]CDR42647.1 CYFA0S10e00672g1_1 [Cyberlindnera fabianii]
MSKDLAFLKEHDVDIYSLLTVPPTADGTTIRKAYRRQALLYHPDKNPSASAAETFHLLTLTLNVLNDASLKADYDRWLQAKEMEALRTQKLDAERRRMKDELELAETTASRSASSSMWGKRRARESQDEYAKVIERLRKEGAEKRQAFEERYRKKLKTSSQDTHHSVEKEHSAPKNTVRVKWKAKEGISELFTSDVLEGIMSVFGNIESSKVLPKKASGSRYDTGIVTFKSFASANNAVIHDYSKKSNIWDNTSYRKLSGLLRACQWNDGVNISSTGSRILDKENMSFEEYLTVTLSKLRSHAQKV